jgi:hypothetical protein
VVCRLLGVCIVEILVLQNADEGSPPHSTYDVVSVSNETLYCYYPPVRIRSVTKTDQQLPVRSTVRTYSQYKSAVNNVLEFRHSMRQKSRYA